MSKIIEMYGTRTDGIKITFEKRDAEKVRIQDFVSITVKELTYDEFNKRFKKQV